MENDENKGKHLITLDNKTQNYVKTLHDDSRISKHNKRTSRVSRVDNTIMSDKSSILDFTGKDPDVTLKNLSEITKKEDFDLNHEIHTSIFKDNGDEFKVDSPEIGFKNNDFDNILQTDPNEQKLTDEFLKVKFFNIGYSECK
jgi:hypothetical protein